MFPYSDEKKREDRDQTLKECTKCHRSYPRGSILQWRGREWCEACALVELRTRRIDRLPGSRLPGASAHAGDAGAEPHRL